MSNLVKTDSFYLNFLQTCQPLPPDFKLTEEKINSYDEARIFFKEHYNENCVSLFLNSFGGMTGLGVYQLIENIILCYPKEIVLPILIKNIGSSSKPLAYWNMQITSNYNSFNFLRPLKYQLFSNDFDLSSAALLALSQQNSSETRQMIKAFLQTTSDQDLRGLALDILKS